MVLDCLHSASLREHARYLGGRKRLPLRPLTKPTREDRIFAALRRAVPKPQARETSKNAWILATALKIVDKRVSARRDIAKYQVLIWRLGCAIKESLREGREQQSEEAESEVETLLGSDQPLHREAWHQIKGWYKDAVDHAPLPDWVYLKWITAEMVELYSYVLDLKKKTPFTCSRSRWKTRCLRRTR